jgi:hypothetical protein
MNNTLDPVSAANVAQQGSVIDGYWLSTKDGDSRARWLFDRHYSRRRYRDRRSQKLFVGPGEKMVLLTQQCNALFIWRKFKSDDGQVGLNCAVFRNESQYQASLLILEAEALAQQRWPLETRYYTYVNPRAIQSRNPGYCFKCAGWRVCGKSKGGLVILEKHNDQLS